MSKHGSRLEPQMWGLPLPLNFPLFLFSLSSHLCSGVKVIDRVRESSVCSRVLCPREGLLLCSLSFLLGMVVPRDGRLAEEEEVGHR